MLWELPGRSPVKDVEKGVEEASLGHCHVWMAVLEQLFQKRTGLRAAKNLGP